MKIALNARENSDKVVLDGLTPGKRAATLWSKLARFVPKKWDPKLFRAKVALSRPVFLLWKSFASQEWLHFRDNYETPQKHFLCRASRTPRQFLGQGPQLWSRISKRDVLAAPSFSGFHFPSPIRGYGLSSDFSGNFEAHARLAARVLRRPRPPPQDLKSIIWDQI